MAATALSMIAIVLSLASQTSTNQTLTNPTPSDARSNQFEEPKGASWKVFALDSYPDGPLTIIEVEEVRQQNPPSTWGVFVRNRSLTPVPSYRLAAAVVGGDGTVKAVQPLPAIKNLKPGKVSRQEMRVQVAALVPSDRVVFFVNEVEGFAGPWKAAGADVSTLITAAAKKLPVQ